MTTKYIESFPTIDLCVDYLVKNGCNWDNDKENHLKAKGSYKHKDILVFYDPYELLSLKEQSK